MGLLDAFYSQGTTPPNPNASMPQLLSSPLGQGLLGAVFSYAANAQRGAPVNSLGRGGLGGLLAYGQAQDRDARMAEEQQQRQVRAMQLQQMQASLADQELAKKTAAQFYTPGAPAVAPLDSALPAEFRTGAVQQPARPAAFDMQGYAQARMQQNPSEGLKLMAELQKESPYGKIDPKDYTPASIAKFGATRNFADLVPRNKVEVSNGYAYDPYGTKPGTVLPNPNQPFMLGARGEIVPNSAFQDYEKAKAAAGASRTQVNVAQNTDKSYFGNVAEGLAKNDVAVIEAARAAPDRIASARRVKELLAQNPITGTGAEQRLAVDRAFATAGLIDPARANATEALVTELASQTLDSIKTSGLGSGQGFTDRDRQFLQDARSGRIEMTPANINRIATLNEDAARLSLRRGNAVIGKLRANPKSGDMGQGLDLIEEPAAPKPAASAPTPTMRWDPQTRKLVPVR